MKRQRHIGSFFSKRVARDEGGKHKDIAENTSALRRLNTYLRCTQTEERLTALALIHMNYETDIDKNRVCKLFLNKYPRRMEKASLLFE